MRARFQVLAIASLLYCSSAVAADELIPVGSEWRWLHPTDGMDPGKEDKEFHKTWHTLEFDDAKWKSGKDKEGPHGGFGYGEEDFEGVDIGTPPADDPADEKNGVKRRTAYFRHAFEAKDEVASLVLKLQRDDGIVVYLDGKEIARDNVGLNDDSYELMAFTTTADVEETKVREYKLKGPLKPGKHILAISLHNRAGGSSDLRIAEISLAEGKAAEAAVEVKPTDPDKDTRPAETKPSDSQDEKEDDAKE